MDIAKVARKVLNDLSKNVFKSNSDFINKALEVVTLENGEVRHCNTYVVSQL